MTGKQRARRSSHPAEPAALDKPREFKARYDEGKALRSKVPRGRHAEWKPKGRRHDPMALLEQSSEGRVAALIPIRYGRMMQSPFTFFRGAAAIMAADLSTSPASGIRVQACGDCHLLNFGGFATPERRIIFDLSDFDETLPAPWEWDLKRLATSFVVAGRSNGFKTKHEREGALACVRAYRERLAEYAARHALEVWYANLDTEDVVASFDSKRREAVRKRVKKLVTKSIAEDDFPKLTRLEKGRPVIKDNPPLIYHPQQADKKAFHRVIETAFKRYRDTLPDERRVLLDRYQIVDLAAKVVGVGSVGTRCAALLMMASSNDALFLQVKEARVSVLEPYAGKTAYQNRGQRVVIGQRLMQASSDIFLGWTETPDAHFHVRQLREMKIKPPVETMDRDALADYAGLCGWGLARAHAKAGDVAGIAGYMGKSAAFDEAVADFAMDYADQNERDHAALVAAVRSGRLPALVEH